MAKKRMCLKGLCLFFVMAFFYGMARADEVVLVNGNVLTGHVIKAEKGTITLTTDYSEPVLIKTSAIKSISTDGPVEVHLTSGEVLKGKLSTIAGEITVESSEGRKSSAISWDQLKSINPPPVRWSGNVSLGLNSQSGNTKRTSISIGAEASRKTEIDRANFRFLYNYAEDNGKVSARNAFGTLSYDYLFSDRFYGYLALEMLSDRFRDLSLRTTVGPGVGYQVWDYPGRSLSLELGASYVNENHVTGTDDSWMAARAAANFSWKIIDAMTFKDYLELYDRVDKVSKYTFRNEASVTTGLTSSWALKVSNIVEYDGMPAPGIKKADVFWILALQYSF
jgi:putative salt-induced outer membrane protein YdiY